MEDALNYQGLELVHRVSELLAAGRTDEAEQLLISAKAEAVARGDSRQIELIASELISLYCTTEPKRYQEAEAVSLERERLREDASSRLQTALLLFYSSRNSEQAAMKAREAIQVSKAQDDSVSLYSSISLLGSILLKLRQSEEAVSLLGELEEIIYSDASGSPRRFVVGDETPFLEGLKERHLADGRVARMASTLSSLCRDPSFAKRLSALSDG
jgi:hypothetical protein